MGDRNQVRQEVWKALRAVARPDSRFHFDFGEFITDFEGSEQATARLLAMDVYQRAGVVFITPDNCLELLRAQAVRDDKVMLMTTYGIRRGFVELRRADVPPGMEEWAVLLDVIERVGHYLSLEELQRRYHIDLLVTGGSAVTLQGARFGKGHGFFDIEWAVLYSLGVVDTATPVVDVVHDCQVIDEALDVTPFDTICDYIVTPTRTLHVPQPQKPVGGVYWERLQPGMMESISVLPELRALQAAGRLRPGLSPG
jgi:5-formyltetrahydrofolate cyclo-ligase